MRWLIEVLILNDVVVISWNWEIIYWILGDFLILDYV